LLAILVGIVILLCVGLVLIVQAIRGGGDKGTATPKATTTARVPPTVTVSLLTPTTAVTPTNTIELPTGGLETPTPFSEIAPGATVVVQGTLGGGLNLRDQPTTYAKIVTNAKEGATLVVLEGPRDSDGYVWWRLRAPDGKEGWAAANWLALKTGP
jgi:phage shock protein C